LNRAAQVKDSGNMIPDFSCQLDVIECPLLATPVAYLLFTVF
jgi:CDP-diglyceride synthetase